MKKSLPPEESHEEKKGSLDSPKYLGIRVTCNGNQLVTHSVKSAIRM